MAKEFILPFSELKATLDDTPIEPTLEITENGVYNVKGYVYADVNVEGGGGSSDIATILQSVPESSASSTDESGIVFWFEATYDNPDFIYVDSVTLTVDDESYTFENAVVGSASHQFTDYNVSIHPGGYIGESFVDGGAFSFYPVPETSVDIKWSASNIYTASEETKALFPDQFYQG